ncbi:MAG: DUF2723 domain-containing protein, partial [candidate division WOR-3 bacterium]
MTLAVNRRATIALLVSLLAPLLLYVFTCCRSIFWMDSTEFMLVGIDLGISHPPGYPLLTLITRVVSLTPVLPIPLRLNLISGFAAAGSCLALSYLIWRLTDDTLAGLIGALIWGVSFELWQQATALEVYALQVFLFSTLLSAISHWSIQTNSNNTSSLRHLLLTCFLLGLAFANHLFIVWLLPCLVALFLTGNWRSLRASWTLLALVMLSLGPTLYAYVPLRSSASKSIYWS